MKASRVKFLMLSREFNKGVRKCIYAVPVFLVVLLSACGGGGSSSGAGVNKFADECVQKTEVTSSSLLTGISLTKYEYKNVCAFPINLAFHLPATGNISEIVQLEQGQIHEKSIGIYRTFACRVPYTPGLKKTGELQYEPQCS